MNVWDGAALVGEAVACAPRVLSMRGSIAVLTLRLISTAAIWVAVRLEISCSSWLDADFCLELEQPMIALRRKTWPCVRWLLSFTEPATLRRRVTTPSPTAPT